MLARVLRAIVNQMSSSQVIIEIPEIQRHRVTTSLRCDKRKGTRTTRNRALSRQSKHLANGNRNISKRRNRVPRSETGPIVEVHSVGFLPSALHYLPYPVHAKRWVVVHEVEPPTISRKDAFWGNLLYPERQAGSRARLARGRYPLPPTYGRYIP